LKQESISDRCQGETVLQNGDSTAKGVLYPAGYWLLHYKHVKVLPSFLIALYFTSKMKSQKYI
jgi:hypothetical protein